MRSLLRLRDRFKVAVRDLLLDFNCDNLFVDSLDLERLLDFHPVKKRLDLCRVTGDRDLDLEPRLDRSRDRSRRVDDVTWCRDNVDLARLRVDSLRSRDLERERRLRWRAPVNRFCGLGKTCK